MATGLQEGSEEGGTATLYTYTAEHRQDGLASLLDMRITLSCPDHPIYKEMVSALSKDVNYNIVGPRFRESGGARYALRNLGLAHRAVRLARKYPIGAIAYQQAKDRMVARSRERANLVHCCGHLVYDGAGWIGDYENVNVLGFYSPRILRSRLFTEHVRRRLLSPACRALRVWSPSARKSFEALFPDESIRKKLHVVYPSMGLPGVPNASRGHSAILRILFVGSGGSGFYIKGGKVFLAAVDQLRKHLDFRVDFICDLPDEYAFYRTTLASTVIFHEPRFSREELYQRFYSNAEVFVMLGMADSYGLTLLEASAFGLPIVAFRLHSGLSDLLHLTQNAMFVEPAHQIFDPDGVHHLDPDELMRRIRQDDKQKVISDVAEALSRLLTDRTLRQKLGERGRAALTSEPLSLESMRQAMLQLYAQTQD